MIEERAGNKYGRLDRHILIAILSPKVLLQEYFTLYAIDVVTVW